MKRNLFAPILGICVFIFNKAYGTLTLLQFQLQLASPCDFQQVMISWKTQTEFNTDYFVIDRSIDASNYTAVSGQIGACGFCSGINNYTWNDGNPVQNTVNYYRLRVVDLDGSTMYSNVIHVAIGIGGYAISSDWENQTASEVTIGSSPQDANSYTWHEENNIMQAVDVNLIPTEIAPLCLELGNSIIRFNMFASSSFIHALEVNVDNQGYTSIYSGNGLLSFVWEGSATAFQSYGVHNLQVNFDDGYSIFHREYKVTMVQPSQKLFKDNWCNTIRLWSGSDPDNEIPCFLCEGYDAYNIKGVQFYREAANDLLNCMIDKGFKIYILNFKFNTQDIRNNAAVYAAAVRFISSINNNQPIVAGGVSMGGTISRYAFAKEEQNGNPLPASIWISFDGPQQFAVLSQDLQDFRHDHTPAYDDFAAHALDNDAAKELLKYNTYDPSGSIHLSFYNELNSLNGNGYPHLTENIGVAFSNPLPNNNSGLWLTINCIYALPVCLIGGFPKLIYLSDDEKLAGSYLPSEITNIDPQLVGPASFWTGAGFLTPSISLSRSKNPTYEPYISTLDIVNGQSKFDVTVSATTTTYHDVLPPEIIEPVLNLIVKKDIFLQNRYIISDKNYIASNAIYAGSSVTNTQPYGDFTIETNSEVNFKAVNEINLEEGFTSESGTDFHAFLAPITCDGINESQNRVSYDPDSIQILTNPELNNIDELKIFPNPTDGNFGVYIFNLVNETAQLKIYDNIGRFVDEINVTLKNGASESAIDISAYSSGIYYLTLKTAEGNFSNILAKQ